MPKKLMLACACVGVAVVAMVGEATPTAAKGSSSVDTSLAGRRVAEIQQKVRAEMSTPRPPQVLQVTAKRVEATPVPTPQPAPQEAAQGSARTVSSTAYCLTGTMASGKRVYDGAVAMNNVRLGSRWKVLSGPYAGRTLTVEDRIGHSSQFDVAMPGRCDAARQYGRRTVSVQQVG